jgi:hypothetical protein
MSGSINPVNTDEGRGTKRLPKSPHSEGSTKKIKAMTDFPADMIVQIARFLEIREIARVSLANSHWHSACWHSRESTYLLWKPRLMLDFFYVPCDQNTNYQAHYRENFHLQHMIRNGKCCVFSPLKTPISHVWITNNYLYLASGDKIFQCEQNFKGLGLALSENTKAQSNHHLCAKEDGLVLFIWDLKTEKKLSMPLIDQDVNTFFQIMDDGLLCTVSGGLDTNKVNVWNLEEKRLLYSFNESYELTALASEGEHLYVGDSSGKVNVWKPASGDWSYTIDFSNALAEELDQGEEISCLSTTNELLIIGSSAGDLWVVDRLTGIEKYSLLPKHKGPIRNFSVQDSILYVSSEDGTASAWNLLTRKVLYQLKPDGRGQNPSDRCCAIDVQGHNVVTISKDCTVTLWNGKDGSELRTLKVEEGFCFAGFLKIHLNRIYIRARRAPEGCKILTWEFQPCVPVAKFGDNAIE